MEMCDTSTHNGVAERHPDVPTHTVDSYGPLQSIQFESNFQITPWRKNVRVAMTTGRGPLAVPWGAIGAAYGEALVREMKEFYAL